VVRRGRAIMGGNWGGGQWGEGCWRREGRAEAVGAAQGWRGGGRDTAPGKGDAAARRAQFVFACGVEGGGSHLQIVSECESLSRDWLCPLTPPISPWYSRSVEYIEQFSTAYYMMNKTF